MLTSELNLVIYSTSQDSMFNFSKTWFYKITFCFRNKDSVE